MALIGLELATGAVSSAPEQFFAELAALREGNAPPIPEARFYLGLALMAGGLVLAASFSWVGWGRPGIVLDEAKRCPRCGEETKRLRRRQVQKIVDDLFDRRCARRRCSKCRWEGLVARD